MITYEEFVMIYTLHRQGYSIRAIAKMTNLNRRTVSKRLKEEELKPRKKVVYKSKLDPFKDIMFSQIQTGFGILLLLNLLVFCRILRYWFFSKIYLVLQTGGCRAVRIT